MKHLETELITRLGDMKEKAAYMYRKFKNQPGIDYELGYSVAIEDVLTMLKLHFKVANVLKTEKR